MIKAADRPPSTLIEQLFLPAQELEVFADVLGKEVLVEVLFFGKKAKKLIAEEIGTLLILVLEQIPVGDVEQLTGVIIIKVRRKLTIFNGVEALYL